MVANTIKIRKELENVKFNSDEDMKNKPTLKVGDEVIIFSTFGFPTKSAKILKLSENCVGYEVPRLFGTPGINWDLRQNVEKITK